MSHELLKKLYTTRHLTEAEYRELLLAMDDPLRAQAAEWAVQVRQETFGRQVFLRGLIELTNVCAGDCLYCGIRKSNSHVTRYRLSPEEILSCCENGYRLGFRTFVLQGGEDPWFTDERLVPLVREIRETYPDCAITLSLGERSAESYRALREAGADRYLLRHETADPAHYARLHPETASWQHRMDCLHTLQALGFQTGCGFMVGSPYQTTEHLAKDLFFVQEFRPAMCGIGPFLPHEGTPFAQEKSGSLEQTLFLLSLLRLIKPDLLLPATTALATLSPTGREQGILAGANVIMPNLSPPAARENYVLYDHKANTGLESAEGVAELQQAIRAIGYEIVSTRGDAPALHVAAGS